MRLSLKQKLRLPKRCTYFRGMYDQTRLGVWFSTGMINIYPNGKVELDNFFLKFSLPDLEMV